MTIDDVKLMVAGTKQTKNYMGQTAWELPYTSKVTVDFYFAMREWCKFLGVK